MPASEPLLAQAQALLSRGDYAGALASTREAVRLAPAVARCWLGLGVALRFEGHVDEAAAAFEQALHIQPDLADAQVYLGMLRLSQGRCDEGWQLYRARWQAGNWKEKLRYPRDYLWDGRYQAGMKLLLWAEQGFGDAIQFARYLPWLAQRAARVGAKVALEVPAPLLRLLRGSFPGMEISAWGQTRGRFDAHLPLMDLPSLIGGVMGPGGLPYLPVPLPYLHAPPDMQMKSRGRTASSGAALLGEAGRACPRVGIAWAGRPTHPDDLIRSIDTALLAPLFSVPDIRWINLQKDASGRAAFLADDLAQAVDFLDTASIVKGLDLIVTVDTAIAHLGAALARPVWLLLPHVADWRWLLKGGSTPWYPGMRLFRQVRPRDWQPVLAEVCDALTHLADVPVPARQPAPGL